MDYSKWDRFCEEQSDSEDEREARKPQVQLLGGEQKVKLGPGGYQITEGGGGAGTLPRPPAPTPMQTSTTTTTTTTSATTSSSSSRTSASAAGAGLGAVRPIEECDLWESGGKCAAYYWAQDRQEVTLTVLLPDSDTDTGTHTDAADAVRGDVRTVRTEVVVQGVRGRDVRVVVALQPSSGVRQLRVCLADRVFAPPSAPASAPAPAPCVWRPLLQGPLKYAVDLSHPHSMPAAPPTPNTGAGAGEEVETEVDAADWELLFLTLHMPDTGDQPPGTQGDLKGAYSPARLREVRAVRVTLRKASPIPGAVFWWDR
ncbi:hypothetical protein B484DRAFT_148122, partial [Ochromonadaceae sp. CCMP2298]